MNNSIEERSKEFKKVVNTALEKHDGDKLRAYGDILSIFVSEYIDIPMKAKEEDVKVIEDDILWLMRKSRELNNKKRDELIANLIEDLPEELKTPLEKFMQKDIDSPESEESKN